MKRIVMLVILMMTIVGCSYLDGSEAARRGYECTYNSKGEVQVCGYIN